jgi:superfamily II DNA or RNA helicase
MRIKVGIIDSLIETDNEKLLEVLSDKWAFHPKGYQYASSYKRKHWDGFKRFITSTGRFKSGLLPFILKDLSRVGCDPEIEYSYKTFSPPAEHRVLIGGESIRDYQEKAVKEALIKRRGIVKSPTGSGKTFIMASIISAFKGEQVTVLFDERSILQQTYDYLTEKAGFKNVGVCMGGDFKEGAIMLCMVQSIEKIIDSHVKSCRVLLVDEVHKFSKGELSLAAINSFPNAIYRFGFTATIHSDKVQETNLFCSFGDIIETKTTQKLIEEGKLAKPIIQFIEHKVALPEDDLDATYPEIYDKYITNSELRNSMILTIYNRICESAGHFKIMILVSSLEHLRILKELIPKSFTIEGITKIEERKFIIYEFSTAKETTCLIGTKVLQTGINIKEVTHLINARGLSDKTPTIQGLGRGLRVTDHKKEVKFYDFFDDMPFLKDHSKNRIKTYKEEGHEINWIKL